MNSGALSTRLERSISHIDAAAWSRLSGAQPYTNYRWLQVVEEAIRGGASARYFLHYSDDRLLGAAVTYEIRNAGESHIVDALIFGRVTRLFALFGISICPALLCGPLVGHGGCVLWDREIDEPVRTQLLTRLMGELKDYAASQGMSLVFTQLPPNEAGVLEPALPAEICRSHNLPISYIDIEWETFSDYLSSLSASGKNMPTKARREVRFAAKSNLECVNPRDVSGDWHEIQGLWEQTQRRHSWSPSPYKSDFPASLARIGHDVSIVNLARTDDRLLGAALLLVSGTSAAGPVIGVSDDVRARKSFTYFNLAIYEPIRFAIENGLRRVYLGASSYELKRRRGCSELPLRMYIWPRSRPGRILMRIWCWVHRRWTGNALGRQGVLPDTLHARSRAVERVRQKNRGDFDRETSQNSA